MEIVEKIQKIRKIFAKQLGIGEYLTIKQQYWAMELNDISELLEWFMESWPLIRVFWHKNDLDVHLKPWAKYHLLLLDEKNLLQDLEASDY